MFKGIKQRFIITSNHLYNNHIHHLSGFDFNKLKVVEKKNKLIEPCVPFCPIKYNHRLMLPLFAFLNPESFPVPHCCGHPGFVCLWLCREWEDTRTLHGTSPDSSAGKFKPLGENNYSSYYHRINICLCLPSSDIQIHPSSFKMRHAEMYRVVCAQIKAQFAH